MVSKIQQIRDAEAAAHDLVARERTLRDEFMADGELDDNERTQLERINTQLDDLETALRTLREQWEANKAAWEARSADWADVQSKLSDLQAWQQIDHAAEESSIEQIRTDTAADVYAEAPAMLDQVLTNIGPSHEEYLRQQAAFDQLEVMRPDLEADLAAVEACEFETLAEQKQAIENEKASMDNAEFNHDYVTALTHAEEVARLASDLRDQETELQSKKAEFESEYAALQGRIGDASVSELSSTADAQQRIADLQTDIDALAEAEDFEGAIALFPDLDAAIAEVEQILADRDAYETGLAAIQDALTEASVAQEKWNYLQPIQAAMATIQSAMEAAAESEDFSTALTKLGELEAKLAEFQAAIDAKKAEYDTARASMDSQVAAARSNSTAATATELADIEALIPPIDAAAADEDWVAAIPLITPVQPKIDAFNVAMYKAELPGMTTGLSDDALELAGRSPELTEQLERLRDAGFQVNVGVAGEGSFCSKGANPSITIDPNDLTNATDAIQTLAHEAGHAEYEHTPDTSSRENYLTSMLGDEGQATLNNIRIQREILANGGADIGIAGNSGNHADYNAAYDEFERTGDEEAARNAIGAIFGAGEVPSVPRDDGSSYADYNEYYGEFYDEHHTIMGRIRSLF